MLVTSLSGVGQMRVEWSVGNRSATSDGIWSEHQCISSPAVSLSDTQRYDRLRYYRL